jgi:sn-glycerol 3-phosphate transport system permease protein
MIENRRGLDIFSHVMLIIGVLVVLFPLYVAFVAATLDDKQVFQVPMTLIPGGHLWENISNIWQGGVGNLKVPFSLLLLNSVIMALAITFGKIVVSVLSAYAIVYFRFPLRSLFFWLIFMTLMLPVEVRIFPTVEVISNLNLAALFVITFIYGWNQYLWPILITSDASMGTAVAGIKSMISTSGAPTQWNQVMAAMILTLIPPLAVVLLMQRWFVRGLVDSEK